MADDDIRVRIAGDLADINKSLAELRRQTRGSGSDAKAAGRDFNVWGRQLEGLKRQVTGLVGAYLGFRGVASIFRAVVQATIEQERALTQVEARIKSTGGVAGLTADELVKMAGSLQNATTFSDEAILVAQSQLLTFTRIARDNFGAATEAALDLSIAMEQDLRTSIVQIGRALNDPIKGITALSRAGIQFSASQRATIQSLVEIGQVAAAQRIILAELETQFGGAARAARDTLGGALAALKNATGDLLEADGGLPGVTDSINALTTQLQDPNTKEAFQVLVRAMLSIAQLGSDATTELVRLGQQIGFFAAAITGSVTEVDRLGQELRDVERALDGSVMTTPLRFLGRSREELEALKRDLEGFLEIARNGGRGIVQRPGQTAPDSPTDVLGADSRVDLRSLQQDLQAAGTILRDEIGRLRAGMDRELEAGLVAYGDYFSRRAALETQQIDQTLAQRRNALELLREEIRLLDERGESTEQLDSRRKQMTAEILVLERQRGDIAGKAATDQAAAERRLADQLAVVATRLKAAQGDSVGARSDELEREFRDLVQRLAAEGDAAGIALVQKMINVEQARVQLGQIETEYQRALAEMARAEQSIQSQVATGATSELEGRRRIIDLYRQTAEQVRGLIPAMRALAEATGDPAAAERVRELEAALGDLETRAKDSSSAMRAAIQDSSEDAFASFLSGTRKAKDAFRDFANDVIQQMARIAARRFIGQMFEGMFGAGSAHSGGIAGQAPTVRRISPLVFAGAPRMHSGGIAGLGPGEVPAILKRGEEVLTEHDPRHRNNRGGGDVNLYVNAQGSQDPAGIFAAAETLKVQVKAELLQEMRRGTRR